MHSEIIIKNISNIPEIQSNDDLSKIIISALKKNRLKLKNKDVLVITQKIISKSENRLVHQNNVIPTQSAKKLSKEIGKSYALTQLILDESQRIIKKNMESLLLKLIMGLSVLILVLTNQIFHRIIFAYYQLILINQQKKFV